MSNIQTILVTLLAVAAFTFSGCVSGDLEPGANPDEYSGDSQGTGDDDGDTTGDTDPAGDGDLPADTDTAAPSLTITADDPDAYASVYIEGDTTVIDLGEVLLMTGANARFVVSNQSDEAVFVGSVAYTDDVVGEGWGTPNFVAGADGFAGVPAGEERFLDVPYSADSLGANHAVVELVTSDTEASYFVKVVALGYVPPRESFDVRFELGDPSDGETTADLRCDGPDLNSNGIDDNADGIVDGCGLNESLNFGAIGPGERRTASIYLVNTSLCVASDIADACETCTATIAADPSRSNIGLGFKPGTNEDGYFTLGGDVALPAVLPAADGSCALPNFLTLPVVFDAPAASGTFETVLVVETDSANMPLVEIPVVATVTTNPIAVASLRRPDPENPDAPYSVDNEGNPLVFAGGRVYLDGRAKGTIASTRVSTDPSNPTLITAYQWEIISYPEGVMASAFDPQGADTGLFDFYMPASGTYEVRLTVTDTEGQQSLETPQSNVVISALTNGSLVVQLTWDNTSNDQDLHMTLASVSDLVCHDVYDVHWRAREPVWFEEAAAGVGPNPRLEVDDTNGLGPEMIVIDTPAAGTYRLYVHYWGDFAVGTVAPTTESVRIFIDDVQQAEFQRVLSTEKAIWQVADITWTANGIATITPIPSDEVGEVGQVGQMAECTDAGWAFP